MLISLGGLLSALAVCNPSPSNKYDVIVVGAGTSGITAAIQAARMPNTSVALLEEQNIIGGQIGAQGVGPMDGGWYEPLAVSGLFSEFRERVGAYYANFPLSQAGSTAVGFQWQVEPRVGRQLFTGMLDNFLPPGTASNGSSLCVFTNVGVAAVTKDLDTVTGLVTTSGGPPMSWEAHVVIDATEYGDVIDLAGAAFRIGTRLSTSPPPNPNDNCVDDITFTAITRQYGWLHTDPPRPLVLPSVLDTSIQGDFHGLVATAPNPGECWDPWTWARHQFYRFMPDSSANPPVPFPLPSPPAPTRSGVNFANDYPGYYRHCPVQPDEPKYVWRGTLSEDFLLDRSFRASVICQAKRRTLQYLLYMQQDAELGTLGPWALADDEFNSPYGTCPTSVIPADQHPFEQLMPPIPYVRESRRIVAIDLLTGPEVTQQPPVLEPEPPVPPSPLTPRPWRKPVRQEKALALGDYPMDIHNCNAKLEPEDVYPDGTRPPGYYVGPFQIPFGTFIPVTVDGLVPAEKNLGYTRLAAGASRLQPSTMLVGQAAGAIAALAVTGARQPRAVRVLDVQKELLQWGTTLSIDTFVDVPKSHARWADVQLISTYQLMRNFDVDPNPNPNHPPRFTFGIGDYLKRGHAAFAVVKAFKIVGTDPPPWPQRYTDVPTSDPDFEPIEILAQNGHEMAGCGSSTTFCPTGLLPRRQFALWIARAKWGAGPYPSAPGQLFDDVPLLDTDYAVIQAVAQEGLMFASSCGAGTRFCPNSALLRADAARSLAQVLFKSVILWP